METHKHHSPPEDNFTADKSIAVWKDFQNPVGGDTAVQVCKLQYSAFLRSSLIPLRMLVLTPYFSYRFRFFGLCLFRVLRFSILLKEPVNQL